MKLVVLGANGRTGLLVIKTALERGMDVTAVIRTADRQPGMSHDRLTVVVGNPCDPAFLNEVFRNQEVVVSTLGGRRPTKAATSVYFRSAMAIAEAAREVGLKRVLVTSTALLFPAQTLMEKILRFLVPNVLRSAAQMERILGAAKLDLTVARVGFLTNDQVDTYRAEIGRLPAVGTSVSRLALANFLLDGVEKPDAQFSTFGVSRSER